jgi:hypothetical protein
VELLVLELLVLVLHLLRLEQIFPCLSALPQASYCEMTVMPFYRLKLEQQVALKRRSTTTTNCCSWQWSWWWLYCDLTQQRRGHVLSSAELLQHRPQLELEWPATTTQGGAEERLKKNL